MCVFFIADNVALSLSSKHNDYLDASVLIIIRIIAQSEQVSTSAALNGVVHTFDDLLR